MRRLATLLLAALPAYASAVDFNFATGTNNTSLGPSITVGGVIARAFAGNLSTPADLWRRNQAGDHGLGVCSETNCATGGGDVNELDNNGVQELILLERPDGFLWSALFVSSLDGGGTGGSEEGQIRWGNSLAGLTGSYNFKFGDFGSSVEGNLFALAAFLAAFDTGAKYVLFTHPPGVGDNNDYLVWKGSLTQGIRVPEPGPLALLAAGVLVAAWRRRR